MQELKANVTALKMHVMIHQPLGGFKGQASDIEIHAREILFIKERLNRLMAEHSGQDYEKWHAIQTVTTS